jgi:threonyl-tRNA synthetase
MRILQNHSDFIEYTPIKEEIKTAEKAEKKTVRYDDIVVLFTAVEEGDNVSIAKKAIDEVKESLDVIKCNKILSYPFVHLTNSPAGSGTALKILKEMEKYAKEIKLETYRAPFGWNKQYNIKIKGHPLAEQSKVITSGKKEIISKSLEEEKKVKSEWFILSPDGELTPAKDFDFKNHENLEKFYKYETSKVRGVSQVPPHAKLMKSLEIADYEPGSDPGNLKFYPKGRLIKGLLEQWVRDKVIDYGAIELETPIMYDYEHPALKDYLERFPARQYTVQSAKKKFFLRFSACFGQFLTMANSTISYRSLPLKVYELTRYSFRLEKSGELVALRRLRAFTMPDMHTFCKDSTSAKEEFKNQFKLSMESLKDLNFETKDYETGIRFTKDFWDGNKEFVISLAKLFGRPVLIEIWNFRYAYFDPKFEFNFVDALDKASALSTVQIDHENAKRFDIKYTDEDNKRKYPLILHCSPPGGIERCIYALLEKAYLESKQGKNPILPLWLSPTQVRLCPVNDSFIKYCEKIADELEKNQIRVDIDDSVESVQKKVRNAEVEWVPFIVVIGEKEKDSGKLAVRFRETGNVESISSEDLIKKIRDKTKKYPFKKLSLDRLLSKRPTFV